MHPRPRVAHPPWSTGLVEVTGGCISTGGAGSGGGSSADVSGDLTTVGSHGSGDYSNSSAAQFIGGGDGVGGGGGSSTGCLIPAEGGGGSSVAQSAAGWNGGSGSSAGGLTLVGERRRSRSRTRTGGPRGLRGAGAYNRRDAAFRVTGIMFHRYVDANGFVFGLQMKEFRQLMQQLFLHLATQAEAELNGSAFGSDSKASEGRVVSRDINFAHFFLEVADVFHTMGH